MLESNSTMEKKTKPGEKHNEYQETRYNLKQCDKGKLY